MKRRYSILLAMVAACGCLDLNLLDNMRPMDAGGEDGEGTDSNTEMSDQTSSGSSGNGDGERPEEIDSDDTEPPGLAAPECGGLEQLFEKVCVAEGQKSASLRFVTDEPAEISAAADGQGFWGILSMPWSNRHHVAIAGLVEEALTPVVIKMKDAAGNLSELEVQVTGRGGAAVAITEVLADPNGPEPGQEFVEIANYGASEVDLSGWMIDDNGDVNGSLFPDGITLGPGEVAVVVSGSYDSSQGEDPPPHPSALMIVLEALVGSNGLKNSDAETVELYDADGVLVSQYSGQVGKPVEGLSVAKLAAELPDGDLWAFVPEPCGSSTPGQAAFLLDE